MSDATHATGSGTDGAEGPRPRVLHIGNIANNAYLNARILRARGWDCAAVSYDYKHIMGCPEWEDADFDGSPGDHFDPDWASVDLRGFRRPDWFVSGPLAECLVRLSQYGCAGAEPSADAEAVLTIARRNERIRGVVGRAGATARSVLNRIADLAPGGLARRGRRLVERSESAGRRLVAAAVARLSPAPVTGGTAPKPRELATHGMTPDDVGPYLGTLAAWSLALSRFDVIIGYGLDGIHPLLAGKRPYLAFEHGTIRSIPFEDNAQGRRCAAAYKAADGVLVTNCDNRVAAERLGVRHYRFLPHPVNEMPPDESRANRLREELRASLGAEFLVFHPARQHWDPALRDPNWEKGNDILIRGFAEFLARTDRRAGLVMVRWGHSLAQTDALLASLGIADRVHWIEPLPHVRMSEMVLATDVVADQFHIGAFGSLTPKGLMLGRPVLLKLDESMHRWCFPELPPVLQSATPAEVRDHLCRMRSDPAAYRETAAASSRWYRRYHSNDVVASTLESEILRVWRAAASARDD